MATRQPARIRVRTVAAAAFAAVSAALFVGVVLLATLAIAGVRLGPDASSTHTSSATAANAAAWMPLSSAAPQAVANTLLSSSFYTAALSGSDFGPVLRSCQPGEATLVRSLRPSAAIPDLWVLPMLDVSGHTRVLLTAAYDAAAQRVGQPALGLVRPGDFNYARPMPPVSLNQALAAIVARGLRPALAGANAPSLVYFPPAPPQSDTTPWTGGGSSNAPMWRIVAGDGSAYFVGVDGRVYTLAQLPIDPAA
jgi:hypothetical protein